MIRTRHKWTAADDAHLRRSYGKAPLATIAQRLGVGTGAVRNRARVLGIQAPRMWKPEEVEQLRTLYATHSAAEIGALIGRRKAGVYQMAKKLGLRKSREWIAERTRQAMADPAHPGRRSRFKPGHRTWNKGIPFAASGASAPHRFKPGHRPHTWRPIGSYKAADGYIWRKLTDTGDSRRDYAPVHHLVWRLHGGSVPPGHALVFRDGNRSNLSVANLELVSRRELMARNTIHRYPEEIKAAMRAVAALTRKLNEAQP